MSKITRGHARFYTCAVVPEEPIYFPENDVRCINCPKCERDPMNSHRNVCRAMKGDNILFYPDLGIDEKCPLIFHEDQKEKEEASCQK